MPETTARRAKPNDSFSPLATRLEFCCLLRTLFLAQWGCRTRRRAVCASIGRVRPASSASGQPVCPPPRRQEGLCPNRVFAHLREIAGLSWFCVSAGRSLGQICQRCEQPAMTLDRIAQSERLECSE